MGEQIGLEAVFGLSDFSAGLNDYLSGLDKAEGATGGFTASLSKGWGGLSDVVGKAAGILSGAVVAGAAAAGAAIVGVGAQGISAFTDFQSSMNEVFTLLPGISQSSMNDMSEQVKQFSKDFGVLPDEVVPALYQALSAGVPQDNVFNFLEVANKAATGGVSDLETAVNGISSVVNAYGTDVLSAGQASDMMFTAVKLGKTNFEELSGSLYNVIPTASSLGVEFGNVTAALAAMTLQGTPTSVATTQLRSLLVELSKDGSKAADTFQQMSGKTFVEFTKSGGNVADALAIMEKAAQQNGVRLSDMFSSVEAGNAALALTGKGAQTFRDDIAAMADSAGATDKAYAQMNTGIKDALDDMKAAWAVALIDIGQKLAPFVQKLADLSAKVLPVLVTALEKVFDVVGEVAGGFADMLVGVVDLLPPLTGAGKAFSELIAQLTGIGLETDDTTAGIYDFIKALTGSSETAAKVSNAIGDLGYALGNCYDAVVAMGTSVKDLVKPLIDAVTHFVSWKDVTVVLGAALATALVPAIAGAVVALGGVVLAMAPVLLAFTAATLAVAALRKAWESDFGGIQEKTSAVFTALQKIITPVMDHIKAAFDNMVEKLGGLSAKFGALYDAAKPALEGISGILGKLAEFVGGVVVVAVVAAFETMASIISHLVDVVSIVVDQITLTLNTLTAIFKDTVALVVALIHGDWAGAWTAGSDLFSVFFDFMSGTLGNLGALFGTIFDAVADIVVNTFKDFGINAIAILPEFLAAVAQWADATVNWIKEAGPKAVAGLVDMGANLISGTIEIAKGIVASFTDVDWLSIGADIIRGIWAGMASLKDWLKEQVSSIADWLPQWVKDRLGIGSPSKVFAEIGKNIIEGWVQGMLHHAPKLYLTVNNIAGTMLGYVLSWQSKTLAGIGSSLGNLTGQADKFLAPLKSELDDLNTSLRGILGDNFNDWQDFPWFGNLQPQVNRRNQLDDVISQYEGRKRVAETLKAQADLVDFVRGAGLNVAQFFKGVTFGSGMDSVAMIRSLTAATAVMNEKLKTSLDIAVKGYDKLVETLQSSRKTFDEIVDSFKAAPTDQLTVFQNKLAALDTRIAEVEQEVLTTGSAYYVQLLQTLNQGRTQLTAEIQHFLTQMSAAQDAVNRIRKTSNEQAQSAIEDYRKAFIDPLIEQMNNSLTFSPGVRDQYLDIIGKRVEALNVYIAQIEQLSTVQDSMKDPLTGPDAALARFFDPATMEAERNGIIRYMQQIKQLGDLGKQLDQLGTAGDRFRESVFDPMSLVISNTGLTEAQRKTQLDALTRFFDQFKQFRSVMKDTGDSINPLVDRFQSDVLDKMINQFYDLNTSEAQRLQIIQQYRAEQEKVLALQQKQNQLDFLQQQLDLVKQVKDLDAQFDDIVSYNDIFSGITLGVNASLQDMVTLTSRVIDAMIATTKDQLGIHSPSKVFESIGEYMAQGLGLGLQRGLVAQPVAASAPLVPYSINNSRSISIPMNNTFNNGMDEVIFEAKVRQIIDRSLN